MGLRLGLATLGHNYDVASYEIVAKVVASGGNVYAETTRYNYGPVWFRVVGGLWGAASLFGGAREAAFRLGLALLLSAVDVALASRLRRRFGDRAALFLLFSPVSLLVTGYHRQFDNLALLLGFLGAERLEERREGRLTRRDVAAWLLLGASLATKHILFLFPLWAAAGQRGIARRVGSAIVPPALFALSFLPWVAGGGAGIVSNVLTYTSTHNAPLYRTLLPGAALEAVPPEGVWLTLLLSLGWLLRKGGAVEGLLVYTVAFVGAAPAMTNQYLAIPLAAIAAWPRAPFAAYTLAATAFLVLDQDGLALWPGGLPEGPRTAAYALLCALLLAGLGLLLRDRRRRVAPP
ncbi:MAG: hypothetical protein U0529_05135 [Thermoanaerobaculia bacterium]